MDFGFEKKVHQILPSNSFGTALPMLDTVVVSAKGDTSDQVTKNPYLKAHSDENGNLVFDNVKATYDGRYISEETAKAYFGKAIGDWSKAGVKINLTNEGSADHLLGGINIQLRPCEGSICSTDLGAADLGGRNIYFSSKQRSDTPTHEFGHILGLDHSPYSTHDIMTAAEPRKITSSDVARLKSCYLMNECGP